MKNMKKAFLVAGLTATMLASGCSASDAPRKTAETFLGGMTAGYSEAEANMFLNSPQYRQGVECLTQHLEQSGWSDADYEKFMEFTKGTGETDQVPDDISEADQMKYFAPLMANNCF